MKSSRSSPIKQQESSMGEGILTVLRDQPFPKSSPSIRRTLSADMSSKKWLAQSGFFTTPPPPKDNASAEFANNRHRPPSPSPGGESNPSQEDVWRSIVQSKKDKQDKFCFVPPSLKKRSLSEKSLEICTESLGSETGSDSNLSSSYGSSEFSSSRDGGDGGDYIEPEKITTRRLGLSENFVKYKTAPVRPIPPPIRSSLSMSPRRESGRLVLEAVSGPARDHFVAQRGNGRLVLRMSSGEATKLDGTQEIGDKKVTEKLGSLGNNYKKKKMMTTRWMNKVIEEKGGGGRRCPQILITQSLPPPVPRVPRMMIPKPQRNNNNNPVSLLFGGHEQFWRNKVPDDEGFAAGPRAAADIGNNKYTKPLFLKKYCNNGVGDDRAGAKEYYNRRQESNGCKELKKRSLRMWEPYCVATS